MSGFCRFVITVEGVGFVNMEPKKVMQYAKTGFILLKVGRDAFSLLGRRLFCKNKNQKTQMKKYKDIKMQQKKGNGFASAKKGVFKGAKIGHRALRMMKEYYF